MGSWAVFILFGLLSGCCLSRHYFYETELLTWDEAQQNCRQHYTDLATFDSQEDVDSLLRPPGAGPWLWIGLRDDPLTWLTMGNTSTSWRWSSTGETSQSGFSNWSFSEPNNTGGEACVQIDSFGSWYDFECETPQPSVCFKGSAGNISYAYNPTWLTWSVAQVYCRQNYVDMATVESAEANAAVTALIPWATTAWMGLYRNPFAWSDHSPSTFRNWMSLQPDYLGSIAVCAYETELHTWADGDCNVPLHSICYGDVGGPGAGAPYQGAPYEGAPVEGAPGEGKPYEGEPYWKMRRTALRLTLSSFSDLRDPAVLQQIQQQLSEIVSKTHTDVKLQMKIERVEQETDHRLLCPLRI